MLMADLDLRAGRIKDAAAQLQEGLQAAARAGNWLSVLNGLWCCGLAVHWRPGGTPKPSRCGPPTPHATQGSGGVGRRDARRGAPTRASPAQGPAGARARPGRAAEDRGAAMSLATAAEYALMLTDPGPQQPRGRRGRGQLSARERELVTLVAQGRTDAADRRAAVHQHPHRPLPPGPDPGQDRLPPPRRPDPPGPGGGPGLARTPGRASVGSRTPAAAVA